MQLRQRYQRSPPMGGPYTLGKFVHLLQIICKTGCFWVTSASKPRFERTHITRSNIVAFLRKQPHQDQTGRCINDWWKEHFYSLRVFPSNHLAVYRIKHRRAPRWKAVTTELKHRERTACEMHEAIPPSQLRNALCVSKPSIAVYESFVY